MAKAKTSSFILEQKLMTSPETERVLDVRFLCVWRMKVQLVKHARKQINRYHADTNRRELVSEKKELSSRTDTVSKKRCASINCELNDLRLMYGLSQYQFKLWVQPLQQRFGRHIDSRTAQCIADDIWKAADKYLFDSGKALHIPKRDHVLSVESNDNLTGILLRKGHIKWRGLDIQVQRARHGSIERVYEDEALSHRVKYCRIVRKQFSGRWHYYVQLVLEGTPPTKHRIGFGRVGIDPGTLSAAVVSEKGCILTALDDGISDYSKEPGRLNRAMDRSRRSMNPGNYNPDGTVKRGSKHWVFSKNYRNIRQRKRALERKQAAGRKCRHERLANEILSLGDEVFAEGMNYRGLQRRAKETTINRRGKFNRKSRFGKSLKNGAPAKLLSMVDRKLRYEGKELHKVNTRTFRASQYNHVTDEYVKKRLSKRHNAINGRWVQRDLYSAFLLMNSADDLESTDRSLCIKTYGTFLENHDRCISDLQNSNCKLLSSFGISRAA